MNDSQVLIRNSFVAILTSILVTVSGFLAQRVFADVLGQADIGILGVFTSLFSFITLAELGMSSTITFHLYKPLVERNFSAIAPLVRFFRNAYRVIALIIAAAGLAILPFVQNFLNGNPHPLSYIRWIYLLLLFRTASIYTLSYPRVLFIADQKVYIVHLIDCAAQVLGFGLGVLALWYTRSLFYYTAALSIGSVLANLATYLLARRTYPGAFERKPARMSKAELKPLYRDIANIGVKRLAGLVFSSTDNLIISSYVGVMALGIYDNYSKIVVSISTLISAMGTGVQSMLGKLFAENRLDVLRERLTNYTFLFYMIACVCGACLYCLLDPFVTRLWLSAQYAIAPEIIFFCAINCFIVTLRIPLWSTSNAMGLFEKNRTVSILGMLLNLALSLALVARCGILGVLIGTNVSQLLEIALNARVVYNERFHMPYAGFLLQNLSYMALMSAQLFVCGRIARMIAPANIYLEILLKLLLCCALPTLINCGVFIRTQRLRAVLVTIREILRRPA